MISQLTTPLEYRETLTKHKTTCTEERVHEVQSPVDDVLQPWRGLAYDVVERPISTRRQRNTLCTDCEGHDLHQVFNTGHLLARWVYVTYLRGV